MPHPSLQYLCGAHTPENQIAAANVFVALFDLTLVLDTFLEQLYLVDKRTPTYDSQNKSLSLVLDDWVGKLNTDARRVIIRGTRLEIPGAPNLLLAYLTLKLLLRRIEFSTETNSAYNKSSPTLNFRLVQVRRAAEEIVLFVQDLDEEHLGGFWLPISAFAFTSTTAFLLRCALDAENEGIANGNIRGSAIRRSHIHQSPSLHLAHDLITALRHHQDCFGWDIADICLAQYADVIEKLITPLPTESHFDACEEAAQNIMADASFIDALFPDIWNTLQEL